MRRSSPAWEKRFPYVSFPFCPLPSCLFPSQFLFPPTYASSTQEPAMGGLFSISTKISFFLLSLSHHWLLVIGHHLWLRLAHSTFNFSSFIHFHMHFCREDPSRSSALLPSFWISPVSSPALWSCNPDPLLLLYTFFNWLRPYMAHAHGQRCPPTGTYTHTYNQAIYIYTSGSQDKGHTDTSYIPHRSCILVIKVWAL